MAQTLPEDILYLLCDELLERRDFGTLYNCCNTGKTLAVPALTALYRFDSSDDANTIADYELMAQKWSILWRTIILSAIGKTMLPYCKYIRVLDLENLKDLLEDDRFRGKISTHFFSKELSKFYSTLETPRKFKARGPRLNIPRIIEVIGDVLVDAAPLLETVAGAVSGDAILRWLPKLANLRSLRLWDGKTLSDERVPHLLHVYCQKLEALSMYSWLAPDCDQKLAGIFSGVSENSLTSFVTFSTTDFGAESALALNCHAKSLVNLRLELRSDALPHLGFLKGCTALQTLFLQDKDKTIDLEATQHDVFLEVIRWLTELRDLASLSLHGFTSGAAIVTPVLMEQHIKLEHLDIDNYAQKDQKTFHKALVHQSSIRDLTLESEAMEFRDDIDTLVYSLCQLKQLRALKLREIAAFFSDSHIAALAEQLGLLEDLYVGGLQLTDASLDSVVHLHNLRSIAFSGITTFTMEGLLNFISKLGPGNQGLVLAIDNADPSLGLSDEEQAYVRSQLIEQLDGRLEYTLLRDPDVSEFEGESD